MTFALMEEHLQAYYAWKSQGIRNAWCWHVDAHLDIGKLGLDELRLALVQASRTSAEAAENGALGNSYLPWGGLHCGNYLYPAIREGIVSRLTWVIPPDLPESHLLTWAQNHINGWFDLSLSEYSSLRLDGDRVVGRLLDIPFEMGTLEALELPTVPVLLDVDLDYFLTENGECWQQPSDFLEKIETVSSLFTTVAYSVKGGFTPEAMRHLSSAFLARWDVESTTVDAKHPWTDLDRLAALVRCGRYDEALEESPEDAGVESEYLRGTSLHHLQRREECLKLWLDLLRKALPPDGSAYVHGLLSEHHLSCGEPDEALEHSLKAQAFEPSDYRHQWNEAVAREALGDQRKALKLVRRILKSTEHLLFGLKVRFALAKLYQAQGKDGLFKLEMQKLAQLDVTGQFRAQTMLHS